MKTTMNTLEVIQISRRGSHQSITSIDTVLETDYDLELKYATFIKALVATLYNK